MVRKLSVFNPIPSMYGRWAGGRKSQNLPLDRILEDPFFKDSSKSYFIQAADFIAYALLRQEHPTSRIEKYGLQTVFDELEPVLFTKANRRDPRGIIRP